VPLKGKANPGLYLDVHHGCPVVPAEKLHFCRLCGTS